jgi:ABC-type multidrug transport system fused ATPase/permease subunit
MYEQKSMMKSLFPKAKDFENITINPKEELPNKAIPFIWHFVKKLRKQLSVQIVLYMIATIAVMAEPVFFGRIVDSLTEAGKSGDWSTVIFYVAGFFHHYTGDLAHILAAWSYDGST